jgi:site-specific recombinase XerD
MNSYIKEVVPVLDEFLLYLELERAYSEKTIVAYKLDVQHFFQFTQPDSLIDTAISSYFQVLKNSYKSSTINRKISSLRSFFSYLEQEHLVSKKLLLKFPMYKQVEQLPYAMSIEEVALLLSYPLKTQVKQPLRDYCILEFLYSTGIRVSELVQIKYSDISEDRRWLFVRGKGKKDRSLPLTKKAKQALSDYLQSLSCALDGFLFKKISRFSVYMLVKKYANLAGLSQVSPHVLRHSFASHLIEGGARLFDVQQLLGHESIVSTQIYTQVSMSYLKESYKQAHPRALLC